MTPSSGSPKVTHSSIDPRSPLRSLRALHTNSLSAASPTTIPSRSSRTSNFIPSPLKSDVKSNGISLTQPTSTKLLVSEGQPPGRPNKRKRDSEPYGGSASQLREAQEKVEQKRAKIAARVPSAMASGKTGPPLKEVTTLADLYSQLHRDSSGTSGQEDASNAPFTPKAGPGNREVVSHPPRGSPPGHSTESSPDPIALTEDDQEVVLVKHIRPSPSRAHVHSKPMSRLINLAQLSQSSKQKSSPSTPKSNGVTVNGLTKSSEKSRKSMPDFAVVVDPPPRHAKKTSREPDASRPHDASPGFTAAADALPVNNKMPETIILDTPTPTPPPPARVAEAITDSAPEQGLRRSRRYLNGSSLTSQDIDDLLDATPVPFDLTLPRIYSVDHDGSEDNVGSGDKSPWWHHPTFEARAKVDIQRTLRLLLPADPAEDPPPPIGEGAGRWRAEVRPRQPRARMWAERLEDAFGPGPLDRGLGRKPRRVPRPASATRRKGNAETSRPPKMVFVNTLSYGHVRRTLQPPSRRSSPSLNDTDGQSAVFDDISNAADFVKEDEVKEDENQAAAWTVALLPLVKGKTTMDAAGLARTSDTLGKAEHASDQGLITLDMLKQSALVDTVRRLSELEDVPLGDAHGLRDRARTLAERWRETFGDGLLS